MDMLNVGRKLLLLDNSFPGTCDGIVMVLLGYESNNNGYGRGLKGSFAILIASIFIRGNRTNFPGLRDKKSVNACMLIPVHASGKQGEIKMSVLKRLPFSLGP